MMKQLDNPGFRYTFGHGTLTNLEGVSPGLYETDYLGNRIVLSVDGFGEVRIANETPTNNTKRFARYLMKVNNG